MNKRRANYWLRALLVGFILFIGFTTNAEKSNDKIGPALSAAMTDVSSSETVKVWVFFTDKGFASESGLAKSLATVREKMSLRVLDRRRRRGSTKDLVGRYDLPVHSSYVDSIMAIEGVLRHRTTTKWLNGISIECEAVAIERIASPDFVRSVHLVKTGRRGLPHPAKQQQGLGKASSSLNYGYSYDQLEQIHVPAVHEMGFSGTGVRVLMVDTGYDTAHEFLSRERIVAQYDFINDDSVTTNQNGDHPLQDYHGTSTASALGAAVDSFLYGPAYRCEFLLAKTEIYDQEIQIEEDYYAEALEWGEQLGADVVSSSLGYLDWYKFFDMDGNTAVTTLAVEQAIRLGMVVVTATGNENQNNWGHIIAPADADSVISVGAVDEAGNIAGFSSRGPTYDGRIKPEVVARGVGTAAASSSGPRNYISASGTSLSTPLVAGVAALLIEAHPNWSPAQVREALMKTASNAHQPNNTVGWGIVDALDAVSYTPQNELDSVIVTKNFPNPFRERTYIKYALPGDYEYEEVSLDIYNIRGQKVASVVNTCSDCYLRWEPGQNIASGIYFYRIHTENFTQTGKLLFVQ